MSYLEQPNSGTESGRVVARAWGEEEGNGKLLFNGYRVLVLQGEKNPVD